jgi:hypothetical protein
MLPHSAILQPERRSLPFPNPQSHSFSSTKQPHKLFPHWAPRPPLKVRPLLQWNAPTTMSGWTRDNRPNTHDSHTTTRSGCVLTEKKALSTDDGDTTTHIQADATSQNRIPDLPPTRRYLCTIQSPASKGLARSQTQVNGKEAHRTRKSITAIETRRCQPSSIFPRTWGRPNNWNYVPDFH